MAGDTDPCRHPCTTLVLPPVLGNVQHVAVTAIQKRLQSFFASSRIPRPSFASRSEAEGEARMSAAPAGPALRLLYCNLSWKNDFTLNTMPGNPGGGTLNAWSRRVWRSHRSTPSATAMNSFPRSWGDDRVGHDVLDGRSI